MDNQIDYFGLVVAYLPFVVIGLGLIGNTSAFLIFRLNKDFKELSAMTILSFIVVVNINLKFNFIIFETCKSINNLSYLLSEK